MPAFSIILPTYNRAHLIGKTIESVLAQDFQDFELLIIDDGSTDNTEATVSRFSDSRIVYHKKENAERGAARNYGASRARGAYINFFDSDDVMYPNHLNVANRMVIELGKPEIFHLGYDHRLEDGTLIGKVDSFTGDMRPTIRFNNRLSCNGVFLRKDIALQFPFEQDRVLASSEDWELWIRLVCRYELHFSNEITSTVVQHEQRSLKVIQADRIVARDLFFIGKLKKDETVMNTYGRSFSRFMAERYTFFMLCFAEAKRRQEVWKWAWRAFALHPLILASRRFLASARNSLIP